MLPFLPENIIIDHWENIPIPFYSIKAAIYFQQWILVIYLLCKRQFSKLFRKKMKQVVNFSVSESLVTQFYRSYIGFESIESICKLLSKLGIMKKLTITFVIF